MATQRRTGDKDGNITANTGNLVIGTACAGIDFSAQTATTTGTATAELLDHYEEGTWTCTMTGLNTTWTGNTATGLYTRTGNQCTVWVLAIGTPATPTNNNTAYRIDLGGLPFTIANDTDARGGPSLGIANEIQTNSGVLAGIGVENATDITLWQTKDDGSTRTGPTCTNATATYLHFSYTYQVA